MIRLITRSVLSTLIVASAALAAQAAPAGHDTTFVTKAAQGGMAEVDLAALAMRKSKNPVVLAFARRMNADHSKNNAQLAAIAKAQAIPLPSTVGAANAAVMAKLQGLSGSAFDRSYIQAQVTGHQQMLALMQKEASSGSDPRLVSFARATEPVVEQHLAMAQSDWKTMSGSRM